MINRELTDLYLNQFDSLSEALYSCWHNSFCWQTKQLDKVKLKEQIRSYGFYNHENAIKKECPLNFKNKFLFKTLTWVNNYADVVENSLCEYIELYKQVIKEIESNLFILTRKTDKIAYANIILRDLDKNYIHNQKVDDSVRDVKTKELFEYVLNQEFIFRDDFISNDNGCVVYPNYNLTAQLINHFDFIDRLIELFLCFDINLVSLAEKTKYNLYIFSDNKGENLDYNELKKFSDNIHYDNDKCRGCNNFNCNRLHDKNDKFTTKEHMFNDNAYGLEQDVIPKFNSTLSDECLIKIMHYLSKNKKLDYPNIDVWLFWFNRKTLKVLEPLKWRGTPSMLSNVIQHLCGASISNTIKTAFCTKEYVKPTRKEYESGKTYKEIEQIITISNQKTN